MAINFPSTRKEISDRIKADVKSQLSDANPYLKDAFLLALIYGISGRIFDIYIVAKRMLNNLFWTTCEMAYLYIFASYFGISRLDPTESSGKITVSGTVGLVIPTATAFQFGDSLRGQSTADATIATQNLTITLSQVAGIATAVSVADHNLAPNIDVVVSGANQTEYNGTKTILSVVDSKTFTFAVDPAAVTPATGTIICSADIATVNFESIDTGEICNQDAGAPVVFTTPITGISDTGYVQYGGLIDGTDQESFDSFKARFLFRVQNPVALFNNAAIELEAKKINGVTRVWVQNVDTTVGLLSVSSITRSGDIAVVETADPHLLNDGQQVTITGATETEYNVVKQKVIVIDSTHFAYVVAGAPSTPATGTPIVATSIVEEGQVKIAFARDNDTPSIIPSVADIAAVKTQILTIKPAHLSDNDVIVSAPTPVTTNYTFTAISPSTDTMKAAIDNKLTAFYQENVEYEQSVLESQYLASIAGTVDPVTGEKLDSFTLSSPTGNIVIDRGELNVKGTVSF